MDQKWIGSKIRELRRNKGFNSAEDLATRANLPTSTLYRIESGDKEATTRELSSLAMALNISPVDFLSEIMSNTADLTATTDEVAAAKTVVAESPSPIYDRHTRPDVQTVLDVLQFAVEHPVINENYRILKRVAQSFPAEFKVGKDLSMRFMLQGQNLDSVLQLMGVLMTYDDRLGTADESY